MHASLESHAKTFVPLPAPNMHDDESTHSYHDLDLSSESDGEHEHEYADPHPLSPERIRILRDIYAQRTLQDAADLVGGPVVSRRT